MDIQRRRNNGDREHVSESDEVMIVINETESVVIQMIDTLLDFADKPGGPEGRWLHIAQTDLQKGFMAMRRAIAKRDPF